MEALGRLTAAAGDVELSTFALVRLIHGGPMKVVRAIAEGMSFDRMTDLALRLGRAVLQPEGQALRQLETWRPEAKKAMRRRNELSHAAWNIIPETPSEEVLAVVKLRLVPMDAGEMAALGSQLGNLAGRALGIASLAQDELGHDSAPLG